jgi:gamma-glutamylcyclotransferase (GGCT)/AIG2-like uncharacterized protein YtfP
MCPPQSPVHLFAYGSLVDPECLDSVLGHRFAGERMAARLPDFRRITGAYAYPFIVAAAGQHVAGVLLMDLSPCEMEVLDRYEETEAGMYCRQRVEVEAWGCGSGSLRLLAHTYVAGPALVPSASV